MVQWEKVEARQTNQSDCGLFLLEDIRVIATTVANVSEEPLDITPHWSGIDQRTATHR